MQTRKLVSFFLIVFLVFSLPLFFVGKVRASSTFGDTDIEDRALTFYSGKGFGYLCSLVDDNAIISQVSVYMAATTGTIVARGCIYYANGTLAAYSDEVTGITTTLSWVNFSVSVTLDSGSYVVGACSSSDFYGRVGDWSGSEYLKQWTMTYPTFPDPATLADNSNNKFSAFATYTVGEGGLNLTFINSENLFPSSTSFFGKELGFASTNTIQPSDVVSMSKAIGGLLTAFLSTNSIYPSANLLFNKELAFWKYDNLFNSATSTMTKAVQLTLFELFEFVKLHASNVMLPGWTALTIEIAVAIGVLALVLAICGIGLVVLRKRRD